METPPSVPLQRPQPKIGRVVLYYVAPLAVSVAVSMLSVPLATFLPELVVTGIMLSSTILMMVFGMWLLGIINIFIINLITLPFSLISLGISFFTVMQSGLGGAIMGLILLPLLIAQVGSIIGVGLFSLIAFGIRRRILKITTPDTSFFQMRYPALTLIIIAAIPQGIVLLTFIPTLLLLLF